MTKTSLWRQTERVTDGASPKRDKLLWLTFCLFLEVFIGAGSFLRGGDLAIQQFLFVPVIVATVCLQREYIYALAAISALLSFFCFQASGPGGATALRLLNGSMSLVAFFALARFCDGCAAAIGDLSRSNALLREELRLGRLDVGSFTEKKRA